MSSTKNVAPEEKNRVQGGTLYLVSTPIGNLSDLSERALKVLSEVDFIAAEDTRNSLRLLTHFDIRKPLVSYHEHNTHEHGALIADRLLGGESCALVTDAGTPAISDPGEDLVRLCIEKNIPVSAIPGPVASITALTLSGLPTARFCFEGFLSVNRTERRQRLTELKTETRTMLFHEAPHKLRRTLDDLVMAFGPDRRVAVCRELTKINEEVLRMTLGEAVTYYKETEPRGEYVLVVAGEAAVTAEDAPFWQTYDIAKHVQFYRDKGLWKMDAIKQVAKDRGIPKNEVYKYIAEQEQQDESKDPNPFSGLQEIPILQNLTKKGGKKKEQTKN